MSSIFQYYCANESVPNHLGCNSENGHVTDLGVGGAMKITAGLFEAFLKCPTKCWLRAKGDSASGNTYAEWTKEQNETYRATEIKRLIGALPNGEVASLVTAEVLKTAKWQLASSLTVQTQINACTVESVLQAIERIPPEGRGKVGQLIPIRFIFRNKLTNQDRLLLAFDASIVSAMLARQINVGKIIHGDNHTTHKVKTAALAGEVRKCQDKIATLLSMSAPPDLVLNQHCNECDFQECCRKRAIEQDDLSLLSGMTVQERKKLNNKGVFTVKQHSFAFLPRRRHKRLRNKLEKYHHSVKALAIRENKINIVGDPKLEIEGTSVFFDVEGIPDRDFYYLIGLRVVNGDSIVEHSLWADGPDDEVKIYAEFLNIIKRIDKPVLIHYGSFETTFLEQMADRYDDTIQATLRGDGGPTAVNILSTIRGQVYFPTYSNSLKAIARWCGFEWSDISLTGVESIARRCEWERLCDLSIKAKLVAYNAEDCRATEVITGVLLRLQSPNSGDVTNEKPTDTVYVEALKKRLRRFGPFVSQFKDFEQINLAARWDYQRDRIKVRTKPLGRSPRQTKHGNFGPQTHLHINSTIVYPKLFTCLCCGGEVQERPVRTKMLCDLFFSKYSVKRWIVKYHFHYYWCSHCHRTFGEPHEFWPQSHFGRNLIAYVLYQTIDLCIPFPAVKKMLDRCFKLDILVETLIIAKRTAARLYKPTYESILQNIVTGNLLHADETKVSIRGKTAYVWVLTNLHDVAYIFSGGREGDFLHDMLKDFKGVLVSDFYGVYDSLKCAQQKCLIHLMRDLNDSVLHHPYDEELKRIVRDFSTLLKPIVDTIDHRGLKRRFLSKHGIEVDRFYRNLAKLDFKSERAIKCKQRFEKNRDKLFTFLKQDGIPWHNNNAEHAVKAFARIRDIGRGSFTERTVQNNLILLSICQTLNYRGLDFFEFIRSGETDIYAFVANKRRHRRPST